MVRWLGGYNHYTLDTSTMSMQGIFQQLTNLGLNHIRGRPRGTLSRFGGASERTAASTLFLSTPAPGDCLPQPLDPMQPTNLGPIFHVESPILPAGIQSGSNIRHAQWECQEYGVSACWSVMLTRLWVSGRDGQ